jgi:hypothetical protein
MISFTPSNAWSTTASATEWREEAPLKELIQDIRIRFKIKHVQVYNHEVDLEFTFEIEDGNHRFAELRDRIDIGKYYVKAKDLKIEGLDLWQLDEEVMWEVLMQLEDRSASQQYLFNSIKQ